MREKETSGMEARNKVKKIWGKIERKRECELKSQQHRRKGEKIP